MKKLTASMRTQLVPILLLAMILNGCRKTIVSGNTMQLSNNIYNIITQSQLDSLKSWGMVINEGFAPPNIEGTYIENPDKLTWTYAGDNLIVGHIYDDVKYKFYQQVADSLKLDWNNIPFPSKDSFTGAGSFLSGTGSLFTLFAKSTGSANGISVTTVNIISGQVSTSGIVNFQEGTVVTSKVGDANNQLVIPVGKGRVTVDGNGLASRQ